MKRSPIKRTKGLARGGRLSAKSKRKEEARADELIEREFVFARDGHCKLAGRWDPCLGPLTPHHILKASQGGPYHRDNLVALCAHHNDLIEADAEFAALARQLGLVRLRRDVTPPGYSAGTT